MLCCCCYTLQATCYQLLLSEGWPSSDEASLMRWAANSSSVAPPKHATRQQYKQATALEALVSVSWVVSCISCGQGEGIPSCWHRDVVCLGWQGGREVGAEGWSACAT